MYPKDDLITVKEVSELLGISKQAIYKRMTKDFQPYVVEVENQKYLKHDVLKCFQSTKQSTKVEQTTGLKPLEKMIQILEKENEYKQNYIESLQIQLKEERDEKKELINKLADLSGQVGNTLQSITQGQLADKLIEGKKIMNIQEEASQMEMSVDNKPNFFHRIFGKK